MPGEFRKREIIGDELIVTYTVDDKHDGVRADLFLKTQYKRKSRAELQRAIDDGRVTTTGKRLKASTTLHSGDQIIVTSQRSLTEPDVDLNYTILFEDDDFIVVDKPGNLPVHPAGRFVFNTLVMALRKDREDWVSTGNADSEKDRDFYLIHRLDRETSGVIIIAKRKAMARFMIEEFSNRKTEKKYFAIAKGIIPQKSFTVDADIGPAIDSEVRLKMKAYEKGSILSQKELDHVRTNANPLLFEEDENPESILQDAKTTFDVLKTSSNGRTLLNCTLHTGRQHQIRVHLEYAGFPVVGDKLYGGRADLFLQFIENGIFTDEMQEVLGFHRHALHSRYLKFFHPTRNEWIEIESELPEDMKALLL